MADTDIDTEKTGFSSEQTITVLKRAGEQAFGKTSTELSEISPRNEQEILTHYYDQMREFFARNRGGINEPTQFPFVLNNLKAESLLHLAINYTGSLVTQDYERLMNSTDIGHKSKETLGNDEIRQGFELVGKYLNSDAGRTALNKSLKRVSTDGLQYLDAMRTAARGSEQLKHLEKFDPEKYQSADSWLKKLEAIKLPSAVAPEKPRGVLGRLFGGKKTSQ